LFVIASENLLTPVGEAGRDCQCNLPPGYVGYVTINTQWAPRVSGRVLQNAAKLPPEAKEKRYEDLLRFSHPLHPELFDRLSKDWATLDKFQRTRGVLRFLADVIGVLWHSDYARSNYYAGACADRV
jgi:predicted AAA+ superfamily ATPase